MTGSRPGGEDPLEDAIGLLERALGYTWGALAQVRPVHLTRPTPCSAWTLEDLLAHMDDALDAFTEAASGYVDVQPPAAGPTRVETLRAKACALLGAWVAGRPESVRVGDADLAPAILVGAAALEITLHGWDVGRATGLGAPVPDGLADGLLSAARMLVGPSDRAPQFAPARPVAADAAPGTRLVAWTGRVTEPPPSNRDVSAARGGLAS